jgi:hypothetical protein
MIHTKWPRLIVVGEPVTEDQADQILVRSQSWWHLFSNDREWRREVTALAEEFGYPSEVEPGTAQAIPRTLQVQQWTERHGMLGLEYLSNDRIMSSYIGGPHGWCDWNGRIGSTGYNIGKWPSDEEVTEEWQLIAWAFPFLDLTAQCIDDEGEGVLAAEWRIRGGRVEYNPEPAALLAGPTDDVEGDVARLLFDPFRERGVPIERLRRALTAVCGAS